MSENLCVGIALCTHDGRTYLTHAHTMPPAGSVDDEAPGHIVLYIERVHNEGTT